jgi:hypothetical protein
MQYQVCEIRPDGTYEHLGYPFKIEADAHARRGWMIATHWRRTTAFAVVRVI